MRTTGCNFMKTRSFFRVSFLVAAEAIIASMVSADGAASDSPVGLQRTSHSKSFVTGPGAGAPPQVRRFTGFDRTPVDDFLAYPAQMTAGVRVATGDVNGDGVPDIITAPGPQTPGHLKVFDGNTGAEFRSFFPYPGFTGGVFVAAGDVDRDGQSDIITGVDTGANAHVKVFSGRTLAEIRSFFAYQGFTGGVRVAAGDVDGDGFADIITGSGPGATQVKVFSGANNSEIRSFLAYSSFTVGVFVAAGDVNGDGRADIITGVNSGAQVKVFDGISNAEIRFLFPYGSGFTGGVRVAGGDINGDGVDDIITGAGPGGGPHVKVLSGTNGAELTSFFAYADGFTDGVYVGGSPSPSTCQAGYVVENNNDSGAGSLRGVLAQACAGGTITFAPHVRGAINLTSAELLINRSVTINGPGANLLSVQRSAVSEMPKFRIFNVSPASVVATISGLTISNGNVLGSGNGGGIYTAGTLTLSSAVLSGNSATNGGGIWNQFGALTINRSTLSDNSVSHPTISGSGGGIFNHGGLLNLAHSTISGNKALGPGGNSDSAGGIITNVGTVNLSSSTITGNSGDLGGGLRNINGGTVRARNTIIALNSSPSGPDVNGPLTSENFNFIGNNAGATISPAQPSDLIGTPGAPRDPRLGLLEDNDGPTLTHALLDGSPAIDAGHSSGAFTEQRGFNRRVDQAGIAEATGGDGTDIGAFEFGAPPPRIISITRSAADVGLTFTGAPGATYRLECRLSLTEGTWGRALGVFDTTASEIGQGDFIDLDGADQSSAFYRVRLLP